jgi:hypothetical protein
MVCEVSQNPGAVAPSEARAKAAIFKRQFLAKSNCCITPRREEFAKIDRHEKHRPRRQERGLFWALPRAAA